jgi:formate--tetrahydrofolate ligase
VKTSLEIAQEHELIPINTIADNAGLLPDEYEPYGRYKAKVSLSVLDRMKDTSDAKVVCVTGMTPTKA